MLQIPSVNAICFGCCLTNYSMPNSPSGIASLGSCGTYLNDGASCSLTCRTGSTASPSASHCDSGTFQGQKCVGHDIELQGIYRDFHSTSAYPTFLSDFNTADADSTVSFVASTLGPLPTRLPQLIGSPSSTNSENFRWWYQTDPNGLINRELSVAFTFIDTGSVYRWNSSSSWNPLNGLLFGNEGASINRYFTLELRTYITYRGGEQLQFQSQDDLFVFVDGMLPSNWHMGGVSGGQLRSIVVSLDSMLEPSNIGKSVPLDIFYAHRSSTGAPRLQMSVLKCSIPFCSIRPDAQPDWAAGNGVTLFPTDPDGVGLPDACGKISLPMLNDATCAASCLPGYDGESAPFLCSSESGILAFIGGPTCVPKPCDNSFLLHLPASVNASFGGSIACNKASFPLPSGSQCSLACADGFFGNLVNASCSLGNFTVAANCSRCINGTTSRSGDKVCSICPAGYRCSDGLQRPCSDEGDSTIFCPPGTGTPLMVTSLGFYTLCNDSEHRFCYAQDSCTPGHYCVNGISLACPFNSYQPARGQSTCILSPAGRFASRSLLGVSNSSSFGLCPAGYYCPASTVEGEQVMCGDASSYCPQGSAFPARASPGFFTNCPNTTATCVAQNMCSVGFMCTGGQAFLCEVGKFQDQPGQTSCLSAMAGFYANESAAQRPCAKGHYSSNKGSSNCEACPLGKFQNETGRSSCYAASIGFFVNDTASEIERPCDKGYAGAVSGASACQACALGRFQSSTGSSTCDACPLHTFANGLGSTGCVNCNSGSYTPVNGSYECFVCPPGSGSSGNQTGCITCAAGSHSSPLGCQPCLAGTFSAEGASYCSPCPAGSSQPLAGQPGCDSCPRGSSSNPGSISCDTCPPGRYAMIDDAVGNATAVCLLCSPGTVQPQPGQFECVECGINTYQSTYGSAYCLPCEPGQHQSRRNATSCAACAPGSYSTGLAINSTSLDDPFTLGKCRPCEAGSYTPLYSSSGCLECPVGQYSRYPGASECTQCEPGSFQPFAGKSSCQICDVGKYTNATGSSACAPCQSEITSADGITCFNTLCPAGTEFQPQLLPRDGSAQTQATVLRLTCQPCPIGQVSLSPGSRCAPCASGTMTVTPGSSNCDPCDQAGLLCFNGLASVKAGFWAFLRNSSSEASESAASQLTISTVECPPDCCLGANLQTYLNSSTIANNDFRQCASPRLNSADNLLCGQCDWNAGYIEWGSGCAVCTGTNWALVFSGFLVSIVLVLFLLVTIRASGSAAFTVVFLYFVQTAMLQVGSASKLLGWLTFFNFDATFVSSCIAKWDLYEQLLLSILMPGLLLAELWLFAIIHRQISLRGLATGRRARASTVTERNRTAPSDFPDRASLQVSDSSDSEASDADKKLSYSFTVRQFLRERLQALRDNLSFDFTWDTYVGGSIAVLLFCYTQVVTACIRFLGCVEIGDELVVFATPTLNCRSTTYQQYRVLVIFIIVLYVIGLPLTSFIVLFRKRNELFEEDPSIVNTAPRKQHPQLGFIQQMSSLSVLSTAFTSRSSTSLVPIRSPFFLRFGPLYEMFTHQTAFFWQSWVLVRRTLFVTVNVLLVRQAAVQFMSYTLLHLFSLAILSWMRPFSNPIVHLADVTSHALLILLSTIGTAYVQPYATGVQVVFLFLIVPFSVLMSILILKQQHKEFLEAKEQEKRERSASSKVVGTKDEISNPVFSKPTPNASSPHVETESVESHIAVAPMHTSSMISEAASPAAISDVELVAL